MNIFFLLTIAGIFVNACGISLNLYIVSIIGCVLTFIGLFKLPMEGPRYKKARGYAAFSIPFAIISTYMTTNIVNASGQTISCIACGINIFFFIYTTYYYTESLIERAQGINELAATRSFRGVWTLCGIIAFAYFCIYSSLTSVYIIITVSRIVFLITAVYYCYSIYIGSGNFFGRSE